MSVRKLWRLWALLMMVLVLAWLALQDSLSPDARVVAAQRPGARLPPIARPPRPVDPAPSLAALSQSTLWGPLPPRPSAGASGPDTDTPPSKWTLSGYFEHSGTRFVVVSFEQPVRPSQQLKLGDKLPDGSRIVKIEPDRIRVQPVKVGSPEGTAAATTSGWLPITPGLPENAPKNKR